MSFTISKDFAFSASHQLEGLPEGHQCGRLHGHNYAIRLTLSSDRLDPHGFVVDYGELSFFKDYIDTRLDHRHLNNQLPELTNPTAELMAEHLGHIARQGLQMLGAPDDLQLSVSVSETPKTWATWSEQ